ncbi:MAG: ChaN family lipoprotein [Oligoflexia bacterium]|nr:ChaN family lipoprotein [Oligoflexia bacterium]
MSNRLRVALSAMVTLLFLTGSVAEAAGWNGRIFDVRGGQVEIDSAILAARLAEARTIVLGEKHDTTAVQLAQASIIRAVTELTGRQNDFTFAWEFLNVSDRQRTEDAYARFVSGAIDVRELLIQLQGRDSYMNYAPLFEVTRALGGRLIGVNLSRAEKAPVTRGGIAAADPALVPPGFELGGEAYHERFAETMQNHVPPQKLENYFAAQCLTDDVMAYHVSLDPAPLKFLVAGSFHTDYLDATVARLRVRAPGESLLSVKLVDAADYTEAELLPLLRDAKYGDIADYVYFVNEPARQ